MLKRMNPITTGNFLPLPQTFVPPPPPEVCRETNQLPQGAGRPGSVVVVDNDFYCFDRFEGHGSMVARSARETGFRGGLYQSQVPPGNLAAARTLHRPNLTPEETRQALMAQAREMVTSTLDGYTATLDQQTAGGARNSVVNISGGLNKSDVMRNLSNRFMSNPEARQNVMRSLGIDAERLFNPDPAIHGPERTRFEQGLVNLINQSLDGNSEVAQARRNYDTAVRRYESNNNSVVVAVGNTGVGNLQPGVRVPDDFHESFNINDDVTAVGSSLRGLGTDPSSARERRRIVYAEGLAPTNNLPIGPDGMSTVPGGTSYAAPRVSPLMAELHRRHPNLSSSQIENLMRNQFTDPIDGGVELDPQRTRRFFSEG